MTTTTEAPPRLTRTVPYANEAEARRFARYGLVKELKQPTGNAIADMRNLQDALRLIRAQDEAAPISKTVVPDKPPVDVTEEIYKLVRSGGMRPEAADHLVKHLRRALAKQATAGAETAEARKVREAEAKAKAKAEAAAAEIVRNMVAARVPVAMHAANFDTTEHGSALTVDARNANAHKWAKVLAEQWVPNHRGLTFSGPSGCGKTYLATAVLTAIIRSHGKTVRAQIVTERDLLTMFRQSYNKRDTDPYTASTAEVKERFVVRPELLVLDDFGAEEPNAAEKGDWARGQLLDLVEYRHRERKTTIFTTNLTEAEVERRYDNRILSRITGRSPWFNMAGEDFRQSTPPDSDDPFAGDAQVLFNV